MVAQKNLARLGHPQIAHGLSGPIGTNALQPVGRGANIVRGPLLQWRLTMAKHVRGASRTTKIASFLNARRRLSIAPF